MSELDLSLNLNIMSVTTPLFSLFDTVNDTLGRAVNNNEVDWDDPLKIIQNEVVLRVSAVFATVLVTIGALVFSIPTAIALNVRVSRSINCDASDLYQLNRGLMLVLFMGIFAPAAACFCPRYVYTTLDVHTRIQNYRDQVIDSMDFEYPLAHH